MFFFALKKNQKTRHFGYLRGMVRAKDEFLHTSNIRMRPLDVNEGLCNCIFLMKI